MIGPADALTTTGASRTLRGVTTEGFVPAVADDAEAPALRCYRHPDRETWVRCGRCDQPICSRCAMQGPVGFRCRECGRPAYDPLTSMRPSQLAIGLAIAVAGGLITGLMASRIGCFGLFVAWFAGGIVADAIMRFVGFKRGPRMAAVLVGGILAGSAIAFGIGTVALVGSLGPGGAEIVGSWLLDQALWSALAAGLVCFGAWSRLRF